MPKKPTKEQKKVWSWKVADKKFRVFILERDKKCQRCGRKDRQLQVSHYWDRQHFATRWHKDNCCILCAWCHTFDKDNWEKDRLGEYEAYMRHKLGDNGYEELKKLHYKIVKRREAIIELMAWLPTK